MKELNVNEVENVSGGIHPAGSFVINALVGGAIFEGAMLVWNEAQVPSGRRSNGGQMSRNNGKTKSKSAN